jgi:TRAP-type mannitol/chloroaromatic compound transport system permease large subunit
MLAGCYILYIIARCIIRPEDGPRALDDDDDQSLGEKLKVTATALLPPLGLIVVVLGSILGGLATPTEAAGCGAIGSVILCASYRTLTFEVVKEALYKTIIITAMILLILMAGTMFAGVFSATGGMVGVQQLLAAWELSSWQTLAMLLFIAFVAGFVLDLISLMLIVVPIAMPIIVQQHFFDLSVGDIKVWFSICFLIMIQTSYLTPPMAPAIFYLRGISPPEITLMHMYKGVVPFIVLHGVVLAFVLSIPSLALWLPTILFRGF